MGVYHEPRVPQGAPAVDEHDVWLDNGSVIWGHWNGTAWVVDATADASGLVGVQGPDGDPCPTGGEADTLDGLHATAFATSAHNHAGVYSPVLHGAVTISTSSPSGGSDGDIWLKREA